MQPAETQLNQVVVQLAVSPLSEGGFPLVVGDIPRADPRRTVLHQT